MYPICLDIQNNHHSHCLIIGMGHVGLRKLKRLLQEKPASILIIDPKPITKEVQEFCLEGNVRYECRSFEDKDILGKLLVFAATSNEEVNSHIAKLCRKHNILCNAASNPHEGSFNLPASLTRKGITCTISTEGKSPAISKYLREELTHWLEEKTQSLGPLVKCMEQLRPHILQAFQEGSLQGNHAEYFAKLVRSPLGDCLKNQDRKASKLILKESLPPSLHSLIDEVLNDLD